VPQNIIRFPAFENSLNTDENNTFSRSSYTCFLVKEQGVLSFKDLLSHIYRKLSPSPFV